MSRRLTLIYILLSILFAFNLSAQTQVPVNRWIDDLDEEPMLASVNFMNMDRLLPLINQELSEDDENIQLITDLLEEAHRYIGTRYRRGGKNPGGFDCSGFTGYVFKQFGFKLGASSRDQFSQGNSIANDEIQPGDLLFFKGRSARQVGHVGIAVSNDPATGEIIFIHSSTSNGVRLDRVSAPYYSRRFMGARRIIGE